MDSAQFAERMFGEAAAENAAPAPADAPSAEEASRAVDPTPTAQTAPDGEAIEEITVDEALAALAGEATPPDDEPPATTPAGERAEPAPDVAELQRQLDEDGAREAEAAAAQADARYDAMWDEHIDHGRDYYAGLEQRVRAWGAQQEMSEREIDGLVKHVVLDGNGIHLIPGAAVPPGTPGYTAWLEETLGNRVTQTVAYHQQKAQPSVVAQLAERHQLDSADRATLGRFVNYPPEAVAAIAEALAGKNGRVQSTQQQIVTEAARTVRDRLAQQTAPGAPGAAAPRKVLRFTHEPGTRRKETEYVVRSLGLLG